MSKMIQILASIAVSAMGFDPFEDSVWVEIPDTNRDAAIKTAAELVTAKTVALIWEAISCALPDASGVKVEIQVDCISGTVDYTAAITPDESTFSVWSPELSTLVTKKSKNIKSDVGTIFSSLAAAYFDGDANEGSERL